VRRVDLGGGLTVPYGLGDPAVRPAEYAKTVSAVFGKLDLAFAFEPGRFLVGAGGVLVASVEYVKESSGHPVVVVDAAMNDLIRPALYHAFHDIVPVREPGRNAPPSLADIVGPVCESTDTFAKARNLPPLGEGDLVAFKTAGAYGAVMASTYNSRLLVPEVLVDGDRYAVIRARPGYDALLSLDTIPAWLADPVETKARKRGC
jgi:diaminopimelate decarboxylase